MQLASSLVMLLGSVIAVIAGIGILRFTTPYARFHSAGKASPVGFIVAAIGAAMALPDAAGLLLFAAASAAVTMPIGVHFLFRALYRTSPEEPAG